MNITLALLAGVVLLLPGITGLTFWNLLGSRQGAKRPDVQLTSITALFVTVFIALVMHFAGYAFVESVLRAAADLQSAAPPWWPRVAVPANPYEVAIGLALGRTTVSPLALEYFLLVMFLESILAGMIVASEGLGLALEGADLRSQGWVFQHIVRPTYHGFRPIAYVMTVPVQGEYGIGYEGVVADVRQGDDGEVKLISLADPQRFIYRLAPGDAAVQGSAGAIVSGGREWIGGVIAIDGSVIRNVVVHNVDPATLEDVAAQSRVTSK